MTFNPEERKSLGTIASLYLIRMLGLFMVLPVLSVYGAGLEGATPLLLGLAIGVYGLAQALLQIPFGWLSDHVGRKKVLVFGFLLFVIGSLVCSFAEDAYLLILGRALQGAGAVSAVLLALLSDYISERNRTVAMAIVGVSIGLSFGISVVIGPIIANAYGLSGVFNLSAILGVLALFLVLFVIKDRPSAPVTKRPAFSSEVFSVNLLRLDFGIFSLHFMQMCIWVAVPRILIENLGIALDKHWLVYLSVVGGGFVLMLPFMRFWGKRGQTKLAILAAVAVCALAMFLMSQMSSYASFVIGLFLFFWGFNLLEATLPSTVTKLAPQQQKGVASGVYSTCQFVGVFCGGAVGGWALTAFGPESLFYISAALAALWFLAVLPAKGLGRVDD